MIVSESISQEVDKFGPPSIVFRASFIIRTPSSICHMLEKKI